MTTEWHEVPNNGPAGPVGPKGATGAKGAKGSNGANGRDGEDGADGHNALIITSDVRARCWASNASGQLGNNTKRYSTTAVFVVGPTGTEALSDIKSVAPGSSHSCLSTAFSACAVVGSARGAVCWGGESDGALGNGSTACGPTPMPVVGLSDVESLSGNMSPYDAHVCARLANSRLRSNW